jgi:hypothetical protein
VADALLGAAQQQLDQELAVAQQDAASVALVRGQLAAFRREMEKEGQLQRDEVLRQVAGTSKRAAAIVDQMLQVRNGVVLSRVVLCGVVWPHLVWAGWQVERDVLVVCVMHSHQCCWG